MKRITKSLVSALALLAMAAAPALAQGMGTAGSPLSIGDSAPPLSIAEWVRGRPVDLARDAGKRFHVVEFWAVWCPPCKAMEPMLEELQAQYGLDIERINIDLQPKKAGGYMITGLPTILFVEGDKVHRHITGAITRGELIRIIESENPLEKDTTKA